MKKARNKEKEKERVFAEYASCGNVSQVAKKLKIPYSTVRDWIKNKPPDNLDKIRDEKKKEYIEKANEFIQKGMLLANKKLDRAICREEEIDRLIEEIAKSDEDEIPQHTKLACVKALKSLQIHDIKALAMAIGIIYDKREIASSQVEGEEKGGVVFMPAQEK